MASNGQTAAQALQRVQRPGSFSTASLTQRTFSRLSRCRSQAATQRPQPVQRAGSMSGRRRALRAWGDGRDGAMGSEFADKGLAGAWIDAIAEVANSDKRMIYHYFSGKEALYLVLRADVDRLKRGRSIAVLGHFEPCEETV
jgi:Bacterial regulatory proteins, tetR family